MTIFFGYSLVHIRLSPVLPIRENTSLKAWGRPVEFESQGPQAEGKDGGKKERWEGMGGERAVGSIEKEIMWNGGES